MPLIPEYTKTIHSLKTKVALAKPNRENKRGCPTLETAPLTDHLLMNNKQLLSTAIPPNFGR